MYTIKVELMVGCQYMWLLPPMVSLKCCKHWIRNQWDFPVFMQSLGYSHTTLFCSFYGYNIAIGLLFTFTPPGPSVPMTLMTITSCMHVCTYYKNASALRLLPFDMGGTGYGGVNTNRRLCSITVNYNIDWCPMDYSPYVGQNVLSNLWRLLPPLSGGGWRSTDFIPHCTTP